MENDSFKQSFTNTVMDLLNENLNYDKYLSDYEAVRDFYATLMQEQYYRYGTSVYGKQGSLNREDCGACP